MRGNMWSLLCGTWRVSLASQYTVLRTRTRVRYTWCVAMLAAWYVTRDCRFTVCGARFKYTWSVRDTRIRYMIHGTCCDTRYGTRYTVIHDTCLYACCVVGDAYPSVHGTRFSVRIHVFGTRMRYAEYVVIRGACCVVRDAWPVRGSNTRGRYTVHVPRYMFHGTH